MINVSLARQQLAALPGEEVRIKRAQLEALYVLAERGQRAMLAVGDVAAVTMAASSPGVAA